MRIKDQHTLVLLGIYRGKTLRPIAKDIHKSLKTVQDLLEELENNGYILNPYDAESKTGRKKAGRSITPKAELWLKKQNLI